MPQVQTGRATAPLAGHVVASGVLVGKYER